MLLNTQILYIIYRIIDNTEHRKLQNFHLNWDFGNGIYNIMAERFSAVVRHDVL